MDRLTRLRRLIIPGCPHHLVQRGNRRQRVFFSDEDKAFFLILLGRQAAKHGIMIWAFCLMDNHLHLVAVPPRTESFARGLGEVLRRYSLVINTREGWTGFLWQGRFSSYPLDEAHGYSAIRYVERNPVRAGLVGRAEDYEWSSARAHVRKEHHPLLTPSPFESSVGDWARYLRQKDDPEHVKEFVDREKTGRPLGNDDFIKRLERLSGRILTPGPRGRPRKK
jgi:REP-associated tyrosine transposase